MELSSNSLDDAVRTPFRKRIFDRNSENMDPVPAKWPRTVAHVPLRDYHRQPEYKFLGGSWNEETILRRRHILADNIEDIGKEAMGGKRMRREPKTRTTSSHTQHHRSTATDDRGDQVGRQAEPDA